VNIDCGNGTGSCGIKVLKVRLDTAKLTNTKITQTLDRRNLIRKSEMFITDEARIERIVSGDKCGVVYFAKISRNSVLERLRVKKICSHPGRDILKSIWKVSNV